MAKIASVVVTYNRLELLKECIDSLRNQTRKLDEIIVVNNDSNDGTKEWLNEQNDLTVIHQANLGGAGGFYTGIKFAYEKGYDWIWVMDDDGLPNKDALERLLDVDFNNEIVLNSVVVTKTKPEKLNFGIDDTENKVFFQYYEQIQEKQFIKGANFFNGTLLNKKVIKKIGYPNPYFFIYGDEFEYYLRIQSKNIPILTIVKSIIKHPEQNYVMVGRGLFKHKFNFIEKSKIHYFPRNVFTIYILYKNFSLRRLVKIYLIDLFCIAFLQKEPMNLFYYIKGIILGIINTLLGKYKQVMVIKE